MKIGFDCRHLSPASGGVYRYARALSDALRSEAPRRGAQGWRLDVLESPGARPRRWGKYRSLFRSGAEPFDLLHVPRAEGPVCRLPYRVVVTLHDVTPLELPWAHTRRNVWFHRWGVPAIARAADCVVTDSEASRRSILARYALPPHRVRAIPLAVGEEFRVPAPRRFPGEDRPETLELLFVGTIEPRKNVAAVLAAHELLRKRGIAARLTVIGPRGWKVPRALLARLTGSEGVSWTGWVSQEELAAAYRRAALFLYPSFGEGFGLPVLEAMASGTPVVCSDRGGLAEAAGEAAAFADPERPETIADAAARLLSDRAAWAEASERGRRHAARFTWEETARRTFDVYERVMEGTAPAL